MLLTVMHEPDLELVIGDPTKIPVLFSDLLCPLRLSGIASMHHHLTLAESSATATCRDQITSGIIQALFDIAQFCGESELTTGRGFTDGSQILTVIDIERSVAEGSA